MLIPGHQMKQSFHHRKKNANSSIQFLFLAKPVLKGLPMSHLKWNSKFAINDKNNIHFVFVGFQVAGFVEKS